MRSPSVLPIVFFLALFLVTIPAMADNPLVELTFPNEDEVMFVGSIVQIAWTCSDEEDNNMFDHFELTYLANEELHDIDVEIEGGAGGEYTYEWTVPDDPSDYVTVQIYVFDDEFNSEYDESDAGNSIVKAGATVLFPNGSETLNMGEDVVVNWTVLDPAGIDNIDHCRVWYSVDNGANWNLIGETQGSDFDVIWTTPGVASEQCKIRVRVWDIAENRIEDQSDDPFSIVAEVENEKRFAIGWSLFSVPVIPNVDHDSPADIFDDDFPRQYGEYAIFGFSPDGEFFPAQEIVNGQGYFIGTPQGAVVDIDEFATQDALFMDFQLNLGWNIIGAPWFNYVDLADAMVTVGDEAAVTFEEAVLAELVSPIGSNFFAKEAYHPEYAMQVYEDVNVWLPWMAYWYMAHVNDVSIRLAPREGVYPPAIDGADDDATPENWSLRLLGISEDAGDVCWIGVNAAANDGFDNMYDWPEPPVAPVQNPVRLYHDHGEWGAVAGAIYNRDIRAPLASEATGDWTISVTSAGGVLTISWDDLLLTTPANFQFTLIDGDNQINMLEMDSYTFESNGEHEITVRVTSAYLGVGNETPVAPTGFTIADIYPNPFNSTANISYNIPADAFVTLSIFDLAGRSIATLVEGNVLAGMHNVTFVGSNIESGVYFVNLTSSNQSHTQKLILLK